MKINYKARLIGLGATLTLTGLHKSKSSTEFLRLAMFPSGIAKAIFISTLQASDHTW